MKSRRGFSLIELVIVVVIIGIIAAIAIPRMSRGASGASSAALSGNLTLLRSAIDLYHTEHGGEPTSFPAAATFVEQITTYTDATGANSAAKTGAFIFGPYLRAIPACPVGTKKGKTGVAAAIGASVGWVYDATSGAIIVGVAAGELDDTGKAYISY